MVQTTDEMTWEQFFFFCIRETVNYFYLLMWRNLDLYKTRFRQKVVKRWSLGNGHIPLDNLSHQSIYFRHLSLRAKFSEQAKIPSGLPTLAGMVVRKLVDVGVGFYFQSSWNPVLNQCTTDALTDLIKGFVTDRLEKFRAQNANWCLVKCMMKSCRINGIRPFLYIVISSTFRNRKNIRNPTQWSILNTKVQLILTTF